MSNHARITTKKEISQAGISELLHRINREIFFNCLEIEETAYQIGEAAKLGWSISVRNNESDYATLQCWIVSKTLFEVRHSFGSPFIWWVDFRIEDEVAKSFDGLIQDDGATKAFESYDVPDNYFDFIQKFYRISKLSFLVRFFLSRILHRTSPKSYSVPFRRSQR